MGNETATQNNNDLTNKFIFLNVTNCFITITQKLGQNSIESNACSCNAFIKLFNHLLCEKVIYSVTFIQGELKVWVNRVRVLIDKDREMKLRTSF